MGNCLISAGNVGKQIKPSTTRWSEELPDAILQLIWSKLSVVDSVRFRLVCSSWRSAVTGCSLPRPFPWLMFDVQRFGREWDGQPLILVSIDERRHYIFDFEKLPWFDDPCDHCNMIPLGCVEHWSIVKAYWSDNPLDLENRSYTGIFFVNLISGVVILLPDFDGPAYDGLKVAASSVPTCPTCVVAAVEPRRRYNSSIGFCRPSDKSWTHIEGPPHVEDIAFGEPGEDGSRPLYVINKDSQRFLTVYNFTEIEGEIRAVRKELNISPPWPIRVPCDCHWSVYEEEVQFLVMGSKGELFMIWLRSAKKDPTSYSDRLITGFRVFKLNTDGGSRYEWEEVENFGEDKVVLFLSRGVSQFVPRSDLPAVVLDQITTQGSCIWFAESLVKGGLGTFCMETKRIEPYCWTSDDEWAREFVGHKHPTWFMPKPQ